MKNKARQELRKEKEASEQLRTQMEKEKNELTAQLTTEQQTNKQLQEQLSKQPTPTTQQSLLKTLAVYGFLLSLLGNWLLIMLLLRNHKKPPKPRPATKVKKTKPTTIKSTQEELPPQWTEHSAEK